MTLSSEQRHLGKIYIQQQETLSQVETSKTFPNLRKLEQLEAHPPKHLERLTSLGIGSSTKANACRRLE